MAIAIGRSDRYTALEDSSVDSIRYMWWKQYVFPMIYFSDKDFTGAPASAATPTEAEAGYDYAEVWRSNTGDVGLIIPASPIDPNGGSYSTSYLDAFLSRTPTYYGEGTDAGAGTLAVGILDGFITQEEFIGMSKEEARAVIGQITTRMNYILDFWVGQIDRGYISPDLWYADTSAGLVYLADEWRSFSSRVKRGTTLDTYTLKAAISDAKLWARYFKYDPTRDALIYPDGDPGRPRVNTIESACEILPGSMIPSGWCLLASRDAESETDPSGRVVFTGTEGSVPVGGSDTMGAEDVGTSPTSTLPASVGNVAPPCPEDDPSDRYDRRETCNPDSTASVPEWTATMSAFLNSRICEYYIPIQTPYGCPAADELPGRIEEFVDEAVTSLLGFLNKDATEEQFGILRNFIINGSYYDFDKAPNVDLKLLYKFPFGLVRSLDLQDRTPPNSNQAQILGNSITLSASNLLSNLDTLQLILKILGPQQSKMWASDKTKIAVSGTTREISLLQESQYVLSLKSSIVDFLKSNRYSLPPGQKVVSSGSEFEVQGEETTVDSLQIFYDDNYRLISIFAGQDGSELTELNSNLLAPDAALNDPTMISYLVNLEQIVLNYEYSQELSIVEWAQSYHYPVVHIAYRSSLPEATLLPANCSGGLLSDVENSIMDALIDAGDELASRFSTNLCLSNEQLLKTERELTASAAEIGNMLSAEGLKTAVLQDPIIRDIDKIIKNIDEGEDTIKAAWEGLFNKMTACGLFSLVSKTIEFVAKNDVCGISPETMLTVAIKASLKKIDTRVLKNIYDAMPSDAQASFRESYNQRIRDYARETGYNGPVGFPWDMQEQNTQAENARRSGRVLYDGQQFTPPSEEQTRTRHINSYTAGYEAALEAMQPDTNFVPPSGFDEGSFWAGYTQAYKDMESGIAPTLELVREEGLDNIPPRDQISTELERLENNSPGVNSSAFGRLVGGLAADMVTFAINEFVEGISEALSFDQLLELTGDIPVIGTLLKSLPNVLACSIRLEAKSGDQIINLSTIQQNIQNGLKGDICDIIGGLQRLTLPDIELMLNSALNTQTLKAAFVDALIKTLKSLLIKILVKTLLQIISKATQILKGAICDAARSNISAAIEGSIAGNAAMQVYTPPANLNDLFSDAFCGDSDTGANLPDEIASLFSSLTGASREQAQDFVASGTSCSIIDALSSRLRMDQLIDLLEGTPGDNVIEAVLSVVRNECQEFSSILYDRESILSFFQSMGTAFPSEFLVEARDGLEIFGADRDLITTTCDIQPDLAGLENALREECGEGISEEQIQRQVESFQERIKDIVSELASTMSSGLDGSLTGTIQQAMSNVVPKDDPTNLVLMDQIVDGMFDPFYESYAHGLLSPVGLNRNAGLMNIMLSNKKSVSLTGQHFAFGSAIAAASGPLFLLVPFGGPFIVDQLIRDLRQAFFGDSDTDITIEEEAPPGSRDPTARSVTTDKPSTVAKELQDLFESGEYISFSEFTPGEAYQNKVTLTYYAPGDSTQKIFKIVYDFESGQATLTNYVGNLGAGDERTSINMTAYDKDIVYSEIEEYLNTTVGGSSPSVYFYAGYRLGNNTMGVGLSTILHNLTLSGLSPLSPGIYGSDFGGVTTNLVQLHSIIKQTVLRSLSSSIVSNRNAFSYGRYNLESIRDSDITPAVNTELLEAGYEVIYLNDGNYFINPPRKGGWLELKDILLPNRGDKSYCCPERKDLLDIPSIKERTLEAYGLSSEDERLNKNPRTVREAPYAHIYGRGTGACIEGNALTTIRIYTIETLIKGYASFSKFKTNTPSVYSDIYADYIAQNMKVGLKDQPPNRGAPASLGTPLPGDDVKTYGYWHEFLEQCVQLYLRRVDGGVANVTPEVDSALIDISLMSENYEYPQKRDLKEARQEFGGLLTLKRLRRIKNIEAIRDTEQQAMVVLKELVKDELNRISDVIEDIFPTPAGGWVDDVNLDFIKSSYSIGERNIFDIPRFMQDVLGGARRHLIEEELDFSESDFFVLQSYLRPVLNPDGPEYATLQTIFSPGAIYGLAEAGDKMVEAAVVIPGFLGENISTHFTSFRYGLRLAYVLGDQTITDLEGTEGGLVPILSTPDIATRFYSHPLSTLDPSPETRDRISIPIVFSENIESDFAGTLITDFTATIDEISSQNISRSDEFEWPALAQILINSPEFKSIFGYSIPLPIMQSLNSIFNVEAIPYSVGRDDGWTYEYPFPELVPAAPIPIPPDSFYLWNKNTFPRMKRELKRLFNILYRSNDFSYNPFEDAEDNTGRYAESTDADTWRDNLSPRMQSRLIFEDPLCLEREESTEAEDSYEVITDTITAPENTEKDTGATKQTTNGKATGTAKDAIGGASYSK
jgi:hypothetical protein